MYHEVTLYMRRGSNISHTWSHLVCSLPTGQERNSVITSADAPAFSGIDWVLRMGRSHALPELIIYSNIGLSLLFLRLEHCVSSLWFTKKNHTLTSRNTGLTITAISRGTKRCINCKYCAVASRGNSLPRKQYGGADILERGAMSKVTKERHYWETKNCGTHVCSGKKHKGSYDMPCLQVKFSLE